MSRKWHLPMLIEAVTQPIRYTWPQGELLLKPGKPVEVPEDRGQKVLAKCGGKVRKVFPDWLRAWDELAQATNGITRDDSRFHPIMDGLDQCDTAFLSNNWGQFRQAAQEVHRLMYGGTV